MDACIVGPRNIEWSRVRGRDEILRAVEYGWFVEAEPLKLGGTYKHGEEGTASDLDSSPTASTSSFNTAMEQQIIGAI